MIHPLRRLVLPFVLLACFTSATAAPLQVQVHKVADGVYALVGELGQRSPENLGNNATFGVIVTRSFRNWSGNKERSILTDHTLAPRRRPPDRNESRRI